MLLWMGGHGSLTSRRIFSFFQQHNLLRGDSTLIKPTLFPRINALSSGGWMEWAAENSQAWPFLLNLFPPWLHLSTQAQRPGPQLAPCIWHSDATLHFLSIMILTLAVTFTLPYLHLLPCKQMFEMTRNKEQTCSRKTKNLGLGGIRVQTESLWWLRQSQSSDE